MDISDTRILTATDTSVQTRSRVALSSPARFRLEERLGVKWVWESGDWKIAELRYPDWPTLVGVWRRAGARGESPLELRILPGGTYLFYADKDRTQPSSRGTWAWEQGALTLRETVSQAGLPRDESPGVYAVVVAGGVAQFRLLADDHRWRSARLPGTWAAAR